MLRFGLLESRQVLLDKFCNWGRRKGSAQRLTLGLQRTGAVARVIVGPGKRIENAGISVFGSLGGPSGIR